MDGAEIPSDGVSSAMMGSFFGAPPDGASQNPDSLAEGGFLQQVSGIFDVLQGHGGSDGQEHQHQQQQFQQGAALPGAGDSQNLQALLEEVSRSFMRSGSISSGLVEQLPGSGQETQGGTGFEGGMVGAGLAAQAEQPRHAPSGSRELLDLLSAQVGANAGHAGKDASLEELISSGQVSAETLLTLIESLKAILPNNPGQPPGMPQQNLAALAEILGLSQGESNPGGGVGKPAEPGMHLLQQHQQHLQQHQHQHGLGPSDAYGVQGGAMIHSSLGSGLPPNPASFSAPNTPAHRSNLGPGGYQQGTGSMALGSAGGILTQRQPSSLRSRRGLPDLPVNRPSAMRGSGAPISPLSQGATPSPKTGKRMANGPLQQGLSWPLSPASKSPRSDGHMSPGGSHLGVTGGGPKLPNGGNFPASPTTSLLGDLSRLAVQRPATPSNSSLAPTGSGDSLIKLEPSILGPPAVVEAGGGAKSADGSGDVYEMGDDFGDGDGGDGGGGGCSPGEEGGHGSRPKHSTKPRSVAERLRRERIAVRLQRLKEVMPKTDARIDTSAMLEDAVVYIRSLQSRCRSLEKQNEMLTQQVAMLTQQQHQNGAMGQGNHLMRSMGQ